jgi:hypothetical protein
VDVLHGGARVEVLHPHAHAHILHLEQLRAAHTEDGRQEVLAESPQWVKGRQMHRG